MKEATIGSERDGRYVAHLDMLGMSQLAKRNPDLAWSVLCALHIAKEERLRIGIERTDTGEVIVGRLTEFTFSDTIIAFTVADEPADVLSIVLLVTELFSMALHYRVPLRGGIAHGRFMFNFNYNLFAGPALVDAYQLGEDAQWLGICVDSHVADAMTALPAGWLGEVPLIAPWPVPTKSGKSERALAINWPLAHRKNFEVPFPLDAPLFYSPFEPLFGKMEHLPLSVRLKYENTVNFINHYLAPPRESAAASSGA